MFKFCVNGRWSNWFFSCCSDDSTPGAICLPGSKNGLDKNKNLTAEENQALMKRYLQCPGMCRVEVLKKFVRNKYNVDTNRFYVNTSQIIRVVLIFNSLLSFSDRYFV